MKTNVHKLVLLAICASLSTVSVAQTHKDDRKFSPKKEKQLVHNPQLYTPAVTVITTPYLGLRSAFSGTDLMINLPTMNEDLRLLQQKAAVVDILRKQGKIIGNRPILELSGAVEGQVIAGQLANGQPSSDVNLDRAELDMNAMAGPWASAFISLDYDNSSPLNAAGAPTGARVGNSNVYLKRGFVTIGNLNRSPFYGTIGQGYVPFGSYASYMISNPFTKILGRTNARSVIAGFARDGLFVQGYFFRNDLQNNASRSVINAGGGNIGYNGTIGKSKFQIGGGVISDLSDSEGMQNNGLPSLSTGGVPTQFTGFGGQMIKHHVPGLNLNASGNFGPFDIMAEYVGALEKYHAADLTFNGKAAQPKAFHVEAGYTLPTSKPLNITLAYDHSWQALALNLPQERFGVVLSGSFLKNTIEALEYRHDSMYNASANGKVAGGTPAAIVSTGGADNVVTAQVGVYF